VIIALTLVALAWRAVATDPTRSEVVTADAVVAVQLAALVIRVDSGKPVARARVFAALNQQQAADPEWRARVLAMSRAGQRLDLGTGTSVTNSEGRVEVSVIAGASWKREEGRRPNYSGPVGLGGLYVLAPGCMPDYFPIRNRLKQSDQEPTRPIIIDVGTLPVRPRN